MKKNHLQKLLLLAALFVSPFAQAEMFSMDHFEVAVGAKVQSLLHKRGIITYEGFQATPVISVQLFHPDLLLLGDQLYYQRALGDKWTFRTRFDFDAAGDEPLYETSEKEEDRIRREQTSELDLFIEYAVYGDSFLRLQMSQDLKEHKGLYFELRGRVALYDILRAPGEKALLQAGAFAAIGHGNKDHNQYMYGLGADKTGFNNFEWGVSLTSQKVIDVFWPTLKITRFHLLGEENKTASFVQERDGWAVELLAAFQVW